MQGASPDPDKKKLPLPLPEKVDRLKSLYNSEILIVFYRRTWALADKVTLYNRQIIISTTEKDKNIGNIFGPQDPFWIAGHR
jgi:hypothetical protein